MEKVIRNGQVAVLVSWEYGAGWSTYNSGSYDMDQLVFDPEIVQWVEEGKPEDRVAYFEEKYPDATFGGFRDLVVQWVPVGTRFYMTEYDGYESICRLEHIDWIVAA